MNFFQNNRERTLKKLGLMEKENDEVATKRGVTFSVPFILRKNIDLTTTQLHPGRTIFDRNALIAILAVIVSFVLFILVAMIGYRWLKGKKDKGYVYIKFYS